MMLKHIAYTHVPVTDQDRAVTYYRHTLGFRVVQEMKRLLFVTLVLLSTISTLPGAAAAAREQVLAHGAALHGANGLMFDRLDRLYIASVGGREIVVMDPETGTIL